jgi:transposase, IS30 family
MSNYSQLNIEERYSIGGLIQCCSTQKDVAFALGRHPSTVCRELKRNSLETGKYSAGKANKQALIRCKRDLLDKFTFKAKSIIEDKLQIGFSPEQISSVLKDENIFISHELIYQYIDKDRKSGGSLYRLLPRRGEKYKNRNIKISKKIWKTAVKRNPISERPIIASEKVETGHFEGDTVESRNHKGGIATFVDIKSKFVIIRKVKDKSSEEMKHTIVNAFKNSYEILKTITLDNGTEFALHDEISTELNTDIYFANPYSPWERGLNENTNGLIRRFYPKGTDFTEVTVSEIQRVQNLLNDRPRKTLGYKTPKQVFIEGLPGRKTYCKIE